MTLLINGLVIRLSMQNLQIKPALLNGLPTPSSSNVQPLDWLASLRDLAGQELQQPLSGYNAHDNFVSASSDPTPQPGLMNFAVCQEHHDSRRGAPDERCGDQFLRLHHQERCQRPQRMCMPRLLDGLVLTQAAAMVFHHQSLRGP